MHQQRRTGFAVAAGVVAAVLWQLTSEIVDRMVDAGASPPRWLPSGSSFPLATVLDLVPEAGLWLVGMVLSLLLVGGLVWFGVRRVLRPGFDGVRSFLAVWMVVLLAAALTSVLTGPIVVAYGGAPSGLHRGAYWGLVTGWVVAAVVALRARRRRP